MVTTIVSLLFCLFLHLLAFQFFDHVPLSLRIMHTILYVAIICGRLHNRLRVWRIEYALISMMLAIDYYYIYENWFNRMMIYITTAFFLLFRCTLRSDYYVTALCLLTVSHLLSYYWIQYVKLNII